MQEAYAIARQNMKKSARRGQENCNQRAWSSTLESGDHVLVRNLTPRGGTGKLRSYWEDMVYVVKQRKGPESPAYVVEPLQGTGRRHVLHRNLLLPCPYLVEEVGEPNLSEKNSGNKTKRRTGRQRTLSHNTYPADTDSSSEGEFHVWTSVRHAGLPINAEAREFCPRSEKSRDRPEVAFTPEEHSEEEHLEELHGMEENSDAPAVESEDELNDTETWRERPKRVRQPRRVYTYDQLGQSTFQQLKTCPVAVREPSETSHDLPTRSSTMYPFCHE